MYAVTHTITWIAKKYCACTVRFPFTVYITVYNVNIKVNMHSETQETPLLSVIII